MEIFTMFSTLVLIIFAGVFIFFSAGMLLDRDISGTKLMLLGIHISILGVFFSITEYGYLGNHSLIIVVIGFMLSFISFMLDSKKK